MKNYNCWVCTGEKLSVILVDLHYRSLVRFPSQNCTPGNNHIIKNIAIYFSKTVDTERLE